MNGLERYFRWHGKLVATYPLLFLLATTITTVMFGLGLISFREEADLTALWVPVGRRDSPAPSLLCSHWSSASYIVMKYFHSVATPDLSLKDQLEAPKFPY